MARYLSESIPSAEIVVSDSLLERAEQVVASIDSDNLRAVPLEASDYDRLIDLLNGVDLAIGLAPGRLGFLSMKACIDAGVNMVDLSYMSEDPLTLHRDALKKGVTVIPDCGFAPGLSNVLVGKAVCMLDQVESVRIYVGGLPETNVPPLGYKVTWCVEDLIEEYVRVSVIVENGKKVEVKALDGIEMIEIPGVGLLEAFYTDGVRTLHHTIKGVNSMWEKTMRYPGHAEKIKMLMELGFFDETPILIDRDINITPRELTIKLFEKRLSMFDLKDLVAMKIEVDGIKDGQGTRYTYHMLDLFDEEKQITAMARTTAYTASIIVELLLKGAIKEKGVVPPEKLGMIGVTADILNELKLKGIEISEFKTQDVP
jgi:saccharopine dehydrogenase-like NADP-dependent oxidoreductase